MTVRLVKRPDPLIPYQVEEVSTGLYLAGFASEQRARRYCEMQGFTIKAAGEVKR